MQPAVFPGTVKHLLRLCGPMQGCVLFSHHVTKPVTLPTVLHSPCCTLLLMWSPFTLAAIPQQFYALWGLALGCWPRRDLP